MVKEKKKNKNKSLRHPNDEKQTKSKQRILLHATDGGAKRNPQPKTTVPTNQWIVALSEIISRSVPFFVFLSVGLLSTTLPSSQSAPCLFLFRTPFLHSPPLHRFPQKENLGNVNSHHILHSLALSVWNSQIRDRLPPKKESGNLLLVLDDVSFGFGFDTMTTLIARHGEAEAGVKAEARRWGSL